MQRPILSRTLVTAAIAAAAAAPLERALAQNPYQVAALASESARDTERVLTFGPASLALRGPADGHVLMRATELDLEVKVTVESKALSEWVTKADVMLLVVGNKTDPLPLLRGKQGSVNLRALTAWGTPRYELKVSDREQKRQVVAELTFDEAHGLLATLRALAPPAPPPQLFSVVDRPVAPKPGNRQPQYPATLRSLGVGGEVIVRIVVDSTGRVEKGSFELVRASDQRLVRAVRDAVVTWRFVPAESEGKHVRQLIELPFVFAAEQAPR